MTCKAHKILFDHSRPRRIGIPEAVFCEGKPLQTLISFLEDNGQSADTPVLFTRMMPEVFYSLPGALQEKLRYHDLSQVGFTGCFPLRDRGTVAIVSAGSADARTTWEAAKTLEYMGVDHTVFEDNGVAGLWRLAESLDELNTFDVIIVVAGLDAALASVLGGLSAKPVIAVPTSTGYGAARKGETALSSMLTSCAPGLCVMNIDNGYGAACASMRILNLLDSKHNDPVGHCNDVALEKHGRHTCHTFAQCGAEYAGCGQAVHGEYSSSNPSVKGTGESILTVRATSGLSGDMMLAGLAMMHNDPQQVINDVIISLDIPEMIGSAKLVQRSVNGISGWHCEVSLPHEHAHRTLADILFLIERSRLSQRAKALAADTFTILAKAEAAVHGLEENEVCFHEVGALDSILDICLVAALYEKLDPMELRCSPLPMADGGVHCAHGWLPTPAPATNILLPGTKVCGFTGHGETVTPTAMALLKALGAIFGTWPAMEIEKTALVYGTKVFPDSPNGAIWSLGKRY